jgi:hypothetical protein
MKHQTLLVTLAALAALAVGCDKPALRRNHHATTEPGEEKTAEVAQDLKNYTYAQRGNSDQMEPSPTHRDLTSLRPSASSDAIGARPNQAPGTARSNQTERS